MRAAQSVGRPLFFSLLVITVSFIPVFAGSAGGTALPAPGVYEDLFYVLCRAAGRDTRAGAHGLANPRQDYPEIKNPINRFLIWAYQPFVDFVLRFRWLTLGAALLILVATYFPLQPAWQRVHAAAQ